MISRCRFVAVVAALLVCAPAAFSQFQAGLQLSNGIDNNPNMTPQGDRDFIGENALYLQDSIKTGASFLLPSYTFTYNSFAKSPKDNFLTHSFDLGWHHLTFFMPERVRRVQDSIAKEEAATDAHVSDQTDRTDQSDQSDQADESDATSTDTAKDAIVYQLRGIAEAIYSGGYIVDTTDVDTTGGADTTKGLEPDTKGQGDEGDEEDTTTAKPGADSIAPVSATAGSTVAATVDTSATTPADSLQSVLSDAMNAIADSIDDADGSRELMQWGISGARRIEKALLDAFGTDSVAMQIRDSIEYTIRLMGSYVPPPIDTATRTKPPAEEQESEEEEVDYTAPLSLPRYGISDWTWSDLTLATDEDDTASYELEIGASYDHRIERGNNDSLGSNTPAFRVQANQTIGGRTFNVFERFELTKYSYGAFPTLDNVQLFPRAQGRWQPTARLTVIGELAYGYKHYDEQQIDTQVIKGKQYQIKAAQSATIATWSGGVFWRAWNPTTIGALVMGSTAPQGTSNARVAASTYFARRKGAPDLSEDPFTYTGIEGHAIFKQDIGWDMEFGVTAAFAKRTYNQYALTEVVVKTKRLVITAYKASSDLRQDNIRSGELSLQKIFGFDDFPISQIELQLLAGYSGASSNDPNFIYHQGYVTLNVSVEM